jgi:hypothetical protein
MTFSIRSRNIALAIIVTGLTGCGTRPDHPANWHYYWKDGQVVDDMDKTVWLWATNAPRGMSSPHKSTDIIGLGNPSIVRRTALLTVENKYDRSVRVLVEVPSVPFSK